MTPRKGRLLFCRHVTSQMFELLDLDRIHSLIGVMALPIDLGIGPLAAPGVCRRLGSLGRDRGNEVRDASHVLAKGIVDEGRVGEDSICDYSTNDGRMRGNPHMGAM